jgi:magnesium transporter
MAAQLTDTLSEHIRAALRVPSGSGGDGALTAVLSGTHPADIAEAMRDLSNPESLALFNWLDNERAADVLSEVESERTRYLLDNAPPGRVADLLDILPMDDAAWVVSEASAERAEVLLTDLSARAPEDAADVRELLTYGLATAGRLMTDKFVRLSKGMSVDEAFAHIRQSDPEVETLTDLYIVDQPGAAQETLLGVVSLRELVRAHADARIAAMHDAGADYGRS